MAYINMVPMQERIEWIGHNLPINGVAIH